MKITNNLGLALYESADKFNITPTDVRIIAGRIFITISKQEKLLFRIIFFKSAGPYLIKT